MSSNQMDYFQAQRQASWAQHHANMASFGASQPGAGPLAGQQAQQAQQAANRGDSAGAANISQQIWGRR